MDFKEWQIYHQIHPLKLATDIAVTPVAIYLLWEHRALAAILVAFVPPLVASMAMLRWSPDLEPLKASRFGHYVGRYMTPTVQALRLASLVPMAYGAWTHTFLPIAAGFVILGLAWCYGLIRIGFARLNRQANRPDRSSDR